MFFVSACGQPAVDPGPPVDAAVFEDEEQSDFFESEPQFIEITELYEPFESEELLEETRQWAVKADVEELLPYLDEVLLLKVPDEIMAGNEGVEIAWYSGINDFLYWDGEPNAAALPEAAACLHKEARADWKTGGVAHMVLPPNAHAFMVLHELAHHHKHSTDNYDEVVRLFGAAWYDDDCNPVVFRGDFDPYLQNWPVTETFEYAVNDFMASNYYGDDPSIDPIVTGYLQDVFSTN